jgi:hypothetical protein
VEVIIEMSSDIGMSVPEMRQEITEVTKQIEDLKTTSETASLSMRQQVHTLNEIMIATEKLTGNKNIEAGTRKVQEFIQVLLRLRMVIMALQEAEMGTLGPFGWAYAGANAIGLGIAISNTTQSGGV